MKIVERPARDEADYMQMRALLVEIAARTGPPLYCSVGDLDWWRFKHDDPHHLRQAELWLEGDHVVGFAWPLGHDVEFLVHPDHPDLLDRMLTWMEAALATQAGDLSPSPVTAWAYDGDTHRTTTLARRGYLRQSLALRFHVRDLSAGLTTPSLPAGYVLGDLLAATPAAITERVAVHRAAWEPSRMTIEKHRAIMTAPTYRPDLDLVVIAPDGTYAACCIVWHDEANRFGVFEPVGTHPDHRRIGLARALLAEGCRRLAARGAHKAFVESWSDGGAASQLYPAAGFTLVDSNHAWHKTL